MLNDVQHVFIDLDIMYVYICIYNGALHHQDSPGLLRAFYISDIAPISDIAVAGRGPVAWG